MQKIFALLIILGAFVLVVPNAHAAEAFVVQRVVGSDQLLVSDGFSEYVIELSFGCSTWNLYAGKIIYIDTYFMPSWGDTVIIPGGYSDSTCTIYDSEEVNIKQYFVTKELSSDDMIIVEDAYGDKLLVEYGIGCLSMWRYEGKYIDIDIGGAFLDGIGDRIYLFDSNDDCRVWDAEDLDSGGSGYYPQPLPSLPSLLSCPSNSSPNGDKCSCNAGYVANATKDACIKAATPAPTPTPLTCATGWLPRNRVCITHTQDCKNTYGPNVTGVKGPENNSLCNCAVGYSWNSDKTACVLATPAVKAPSSTPRATQSCGDGYVPSLDRARCIKLPESAHPADNGTDVWLCDEGYEELGNSCIATISSNQTASPSQETSYKVQERQASSFLGLILKILKFWEWF